MIFDSKGNVVLQQRGHNKSHYPDWWDMAGGHQALGQTIEQCAAAETSEEIGITPELKQDSTSLYIGEKQAEWSHLFYGISDGPYGFDRNEVAAIKVFDPVKLINKEYEEKVLPHVIKYTEKLRYVWEPLKKLN
jgi:8-oxo-dGTP pyrophosphatase MutT (NUDIX family)